MNKTTITDLFKFLKNNGADSLDGLMPLTILVNGEPRFDMAKHGEMITLADVHPRMRQKIQAFLNVARLGQPAQPQIKADEYIGKVEG